MTILNPLPSLLRASAWDAGNSSMRKAGRTAWSEDDWNAAAETQDRLIRSCYGKPGENEPNMCFIRFGVAERLERAGRFHLKDDMRAIMRVIDEALGS